MRTLLAKSELQALALTLRVYRTSELPQMTLVLRRSPGWFTAATLAALALLLAGSAQVPGKHFGPAPGAICPDRPAARHRAQGRAASWRSSTTAVPPSTTRCPRWSTSATSSSSTARRATSCKATSTSSTRYRFQFDDMIRTGDVDPAYVIFARFQQRNRERIAHAIALLNTEPDWTLTRASSSTAASGVARRPRPPWTSCGKSASRTMRWR